MNRLHQIFTVGCALFIGATSFADVPDPDPARFENAIGAFTSWDKRNSFARGSILFVGSSSIRRWSTAAAFPGKTIINRGFGGSELSDIIHFYDQVIKTYAPSQIFLYAGDNDIGRGKMPEQVFDDYKELAAMVQSDFPDTELIYISIKPSKLRWEKWPIMEEANRMVRDYADEHPKLTYADLATPLLDGAGNPGDVFVADGLHLNWKGYALWQKALAPFLK
jgi:lysophospholipase L1-like esterase